MMRKTFVALAALGLAAAARPVAALDWSDNSFRVQYGNNYHETATYKPNSTEVADIAKTTLNFTHVSGDKLGTNFLSVDMYLSDKFDPAQGGSDQGATEVFAVLRRAFSMNKLTDTKTFEFTGVRDLNADLGLDIGTKNNAFASHIVRPFLGAQLSFAVPGFLNVGAYVTKEWNHNGFSHDHGQSAGGGPVEFDVTGAVLASWGVPLGSLPLKFAGFANVILPKGKDGFGNQTATEFIAQPKVVWDVAKTFSSTRSGYELGLGYQYWMNKYGNNNGLEVNGVKVNDGSISSTFFVEAAIHL
jgi:hypothetical protein